MHIITLFISYVCDLFFVRRAEAEPSEDGEAPQCHSCWYIQYNYSSHIFVAVFFALKVDFEQPLGELAVMLVEMNQVLWVLH